MGDNVTFQGDNFGYQLGVHHGTINIHKDPSLVALQSLLASAPGASYDSQDAEHQEVCLPGTRVEVLQEIHDWVSSAQSKCIFWLCGMAGTGKSTISRTVPLKLSDNQILGASFFFKRGEADRGNAKKLFPTISKQLAFKIPALLPYVSKAAAENPNLAEKALGVQFDEILIKPLRRLSPSEIPEQTVIIVVIDALDECEGDDDIRVVIRLLPKLQEIDTVRLRVFVTSRPDLPLRLGFKKLADEDHKDLVLHDIPASIISKDISMYLNHEIKKLRDERDPPLSVDWPGQAAIEQLVNLSIPLFIFAATICRIFKEDFWHPNESLSAILEQKEKGGSQLDGTYLPVLNRVLKGTTTKQRQKVVEKFQQIVGTIVLLESPLSPSSLSSLLCVSVDDVYSFLSKLHSVLEVPDRDDLPIRLFHLSFRDYLLRPETLENTPLAVNQKERHYLLTLQCFDVSQKLRKNICGLPNDGIRHTEIDPHTIQQFLPPELQYACRYWAHHLMGFLGSDEVPSSDSDSILDEVLLFLHRHFLHWLEAMSLLEIFPEVISTINLLRRNLPEISYPVLGDFLRDASRFALKAREAADEAPLQIYGAALVFAPETAVRKAFKSELPPWISQLPQASLAWGSELHVAEIERQPSYMLAFSPDCRLLAIVCLKWVYLAGLDMKCPAQEIRVLDTMTGALHARSMEEISPMSLQKMKDRFQWDLHALRINTVGFNSQGRLLVGTAFDIKIWDIAEAKIAETIDDWLVHAEQGKSIVHQFQNMVLSSDGRLLVWLCNDGYLQLLDIESRTFSHKLQIPHPRNDIYLDENLFLISFSANNSQVMFAGPTGTVCLWHVQSGHLVRHLSLPLATSRGRKRLNSLVFSPDASMLCYSSFYGDKTLMVYSIISGEVRHELEFRGLVDSVMFSPDGRLLTISRDETIELIDPITGEKYQTLAGHWAAVTDIIFAPNSCLLASLSQDLTIRIWDIRETPHPGVFTCGWDEMQKSMTISRDSRSLACTSRKSITLWDIHSGELLHKFEISLCSRGVLISPDGSLLGCETTTIMFAGSRSLHTVIVIWDSITGTVRYKQIVDNQGGLTSTKFSPDSRIFACSVMSGHIYLIDTNARACRLFEVHQDNVEPNGEVVYLPSLEFSPDSRLLATTHTDKTIKIWDVANGTLLHNLRGHSEQITSLAFSPSTSRYVASGSYKDLLLLWDLSEGTCQQTFTVPDDTVQSIAISPDEKLLAFACSDQEGFIASVVQIWDIARGVLLQTLDLPKSEIEDLRFSHDGSCLLSECGKIEIGLDSATLPISVDPSEHWILVNGVKCLWLPVDFRPSGGDNYTILGNALAMGHHTGRVSIFKFNI